MVAHQTEVREHYGPLPDPETLGEYDHRFPGLAERIIRMAEMPLEMAGKQLEHRQEMEKRVILSDIKARYWGLGLGFFLCLVAIGGGVWLVDRGRPAEGLAAILTALAALVTAFLRAEKKRRDEIRAKDPAQPPPPNRRQLPRP